MPVPHSQARPLSFAKRTSSALWVGREAEIRLRHVRARVLALPAIQGSGICRSVPTDRCTENPKAVLSTVGPKHSVCRTETCTFFRDIPEALLDGEEKTVPERTPRDSVLQTARSPDKILHRRQPRERDSVHAENSSSRSCSNRPARV